MNGQVLSFIFAASFSFGLGFGLALSESSFELEAHNTPAGSFELKFNSPQLTITPSLPGKDREQLMWNSEVA
jgi:hypothetical protein